MTASPGGLGAVLVLASTSERRIRLLRMITKDFRVLPPKAPEALMEGDPLGTVLTNSKLKALSVLDEVSSDDLVIAADTVVSIGGRVLGKPTSLEEARRLLKVLSGRWHYVYTGVALASKGPGLVARGWEVTGVKFRELGEGEISNYVKSGEPLGKAGAYAIQGLGAGLVEEIRGCYTNVLGLPIPLTLKLLRKVGFKGGGQ